MRAVAFDDLNVGIPRLVIAPERIKYAGTRKEQRHVIGSLRQSLLDLGQFVRITKRRKHVRLYIGLPRLASRSRAESALGLSLVARGSQFFSNSQKPHFLWCQI